VKKKEGEAKKREEKKEIIEQITYQFDPLHPPAHHKLI
jgi:hypothetical protein